MNKKSFIYLTLILLIFSGGKPFEGFYVQMKIIETYKIHITNNLDSLLKHHIKPET